MGARMIRPGTALVKVGILLRRPRQQPCMVLSLYSRCPRTYDRAPGVWSPGSRGGGLQMPMPRLLRGMLMRHYRGRPLHRRLPADFGSLPIFTTVDTGGVRHLRKDILATSPELAVLVRQFIRPGDRVWDVGANIGILSLCAAHVAGRAGEVLAIEADPWMAGLLQRSVIAAASEGRTAAPVHVLTCAAGDRVDLASFEISAGQRCTNSLSGAQAQRPPALCTMTVPMLTLDWLAEHRAPPQVLKIDVEGAEDLVLAGAARLLATTPPAVVLIEVWKDKLGKVLGTLRQAGYRLVAQEDYGDYGRPGPFNFAAVQPQAETRLAGYPHHPLPVT